MKWSSSAWASAEPSVGSVPAPSSSSSTRLSRPASSTILTIERRWPLKVDSDCAMDCSSPMSAKTSRKIGRRLPAAAGTCRPAWCISESSPMVRSVTVLPPVLGPVMTTAVYSPPRRRVIGTTRPVRPGWRAEIRTTSCSRTVSGRTALSSPAKRALAAQKSKLASASSVSASGPECVATRADSSSRMRSSSVCTLSWASRQALPSSTAISGSMKSVWPLPDWSWTMPRTLLLASARTGTTYRPLRRVMIGSWSALPTSEPWTSVSRRVRRRS